MATNSYGLDFSLLFLPAIEHFLTSCLLQGYDLPEAIELYKDTAKPSRYEDFIRECSHVLSLDNRDFMIEYARRLGRYLTDEQLKNMFKLIITELSSTSGDK